MTVAIECEEKSEPAVCEPAGSRAGESGGGEGEAWAQRGVAVLSPGERWDPRKHQHSVLKHLKDSLLF